MALKSFGKVDQQADNQPVLDRVISEVYKLVGEKFPFTPTVANGELISASYETEWKEGSTEPVTNKKGEITRYKENYKKKKLTAEQIKKLDAYLEANIKSE